VKSEPKRVYVARPIPMMGSKQDSLNIDAIKEKYPNAKIDALNSFQCIKLRGKKNTMDRILERVDKADMVIFAESKKNHITSGVYAEAQHAKHDKKKIQVIRNGKLKTVSSLKPLSAVTKEKFAKVKTYAK
jgi:hypothetical protein